MGGSWSREEKKREAEKGWCPGVSVALVRAMWQCWVEWKLEEEGCRGRM